jgi:mevalonate kinase
VGTGRIGGFLHFLMATASAPGKIILFGEHAVVYGRPALAVPVTQVQAEAQAEFITAKQLGENWGDSALVEAPDIGLFAPLSRLLAEPSPPPLALAIQKTIQRLGVERPPAFRLTIRSSIPVASGLGSGAAVSVAATRALTALFERDLLDAPVNELAYEIEKLHHGTPSGIDNTVITYAKPVYFVRGEPIQTFSVARPFTLVIADTGIPAPTKESVGDLRKLWEADKSRWEAVFDQVGEIARRARQAIEGGAPSSLGMLMNANHALLQEMTVSSPELDRLILAAKTAGAEGAKLSGGGRGGNMIALVSPERAESVASGLRTCGARKVLVTHVSE